MRALKFNGLNLWVQNVVTDENGHLRCPHPDCGVDVTFVNFQYRDGFSMDGEPRIRCPGCGRKLILKAKPGKRGRLR